MCGLTANKNNKGYIYMGNTETIIFRITLCNNHCYLNLNVGLSDDSKK